MNSARLVSGRAKDGFAAVELRARGHLRADRSCECSHTEAERNSAQSFRAQFASEWVRILEILIDL